VANTEETRKEMDKSISVKVPAELLEKARDKSATTGITLSFVVRKAIEDWVNQKVPEVGESSS
jgi:predicted DNA-binding protein